MLKKRDQFVTSYIGTEYTFENVKTVGELRRDLQQIISELPQEDALEISEVWANRNEFYYYLKEGIPD